MCRFLAYLGPPVSLQALLLDPPHSLLRQSWAPRHQRHGVVNADGFGVGWYDRSVRPEPARYRSAMPMWTDRNLPSFAPLVVSDAVLAAVRSATPPSPTEETNSPPFTKGPWLFAHNGAVDGDTAGRRGGTDSEVLFGLFLDRIDDGLSPGDALAAVVAGATGRLNLVATDGIRVAATAHGESLFVRSGPGVVIASEPFDDEPGWEPVADHSLVEATAESVRTRELS
jgi:glutamine amidotransferase